MKRIAVFGPALALAVALSMTTLAPTAGAQPRIGSPQPVFEYGEVDNTETIKHTFTLRNEGDADLRINNVRTTCGCTAADPDKRVLAPGEETQIAATLALRNRQGPLNQTISIETNDPAQPVYQLQFRGSAIAPIMVDPQQVRFLHVDDDGTHREVVTLRSTRDTLNFEIEDIESTLDFLESEITVVEEGREYQIAIGNAGPMPTGNHVGQILVRTNHPDHQRLTINAFAQVVGPLTISPDQITLRYSENPNQRSSQFVRLTSGRVQDFTIEEVVAPIEDMEAVLQPRGENDYLIRLGNMPQDGSLEGKELVVRTNLAENPEIRIPFRVVRPRAAPTPAQVSRGS